MSLISDQTIGDGGDNAHTGEFAVRLFNSAWIKSATADPGSPESVRSAAGAAVSTAFPDTFGASGWTWVRDRNSSAPAAVREWRQPRIADDPLHSMWLCWNSADGTWSGNHRQLLARIGSATSDDPIDAKASASTSERVDSRARLSFRGRLRELTAAHSDERFEDGMQSAFARGIADFLIEHGPVAVCALHDVLHSTGAMSVRQAVEAIRLVGRLEDALTHGARLWLLVGSLQHTSAAVRDAAGLALASLSDSRAIPALRRAVEREKWQDLREDLASALRALEG